MSPVSHLVSQSTERLRLRTPADVGSFYESLCRANVAEVPGLFTVVTVTAHDARHTEDKDVLQF